jgi:hypothetical protein
MSNRSLAIRGALVLAVATVACGHAEQRVVDQYFNAVNAQDTQTLSSFAAVKFDKKVQRWSIVQVSPEARGPAPLPELVKKAKDTEKQIADNKRVANAYALEHLQAVDQVRELSRKNAKIPANLQAVAAEWDRYNEKDRELKKALADAKEELDREKRSVLLSVAEVADLENLPGEMFEKQIELSLTIDGQVQNWIMVLKKYEMQSAGTGGRVVSRWFVHALDPKK